jgi:hypothetical protein
MSDLPILILFLLIIAFLFQVDFIFYIVYVISGIYLWSRWFVPRSLRLLSIQRDFQNHAFLGEGVEITMTIENKSRLPVPWLQLIETIPVELRDGPSLSRAINLSGRKIQIYKYRVRALRRGYYRLGPLQISAGDLFGFVENRAHLVSDYMTVYPRILPMNRLSVPSKLPFGILTSKHRIFEDPARPIGLRQYHSGDSLRHINWKVSAHVDNLLVKTLEPAISLETYIILNLNSEEYSRQFRYDGPEWAIVVAASIANHLTRKKQAVGLATNGADPLMQDNRNMADNDRLYDEESGRLLLMDPGSSNGSNAIIPSVGKESSLIPGPIQPGPGQLHLMKLLEQLARIEAGNTVAFSSWMPGVCLDLNWGVTILAISPSGDEEICRSLHHLIKTGFNPVLLIIEPYVIFPEIKERARHFGFPAYQLTGRYQLKEP